MPKYVIPAAVYLSACVLCSAAFLLVPDVVTASVRSSLSLCATSVIPAVFPFCVLSSLFVSFGGADVIDRCLGRIFFTLFGIKRGASALISGLLFGFPVGAKTAAELCERGDISATECSRLICFCCVASPPFPVFTVGKTFFGSTSAGAFIWVAQAIISIFIGMALRVYAPLPPVCESESNNTRPPKRVSVSRAVTSAITSASGIMLAVCGAITFFALLGAVASECMTSAGFPAWVELLLKSFFEFSSGTRAAASIYASGGVSAATALFFAGFSVGFSGLSVIFQTAAVISTVQVPVTPHIISKLICGVLTGVVTAAASGLFVLTAAASNASFGTHRLAVTGVIMTSIFAFIFILKKLHKKADKL